MHAQRDVEELHMELKAAVLSWERAEQNVVLLFAEFVRGQLYRELGYPDIHSYAREELGFSKARTSHFLTLVYAIKKMPALQDAVAKQELSWSKAAEVARHATPESAPQWVELAKRSSRAELRTRIRAAKQPVQAGLALDAVAPAAEASLPTMSDVRVRMNPLQLQRYERAMRRLRQHGEDDIEVILRALENESSTSEQFRRRNTLLVVHECPSCQRSVSKTNRGERQLSPAQAAAVRCDATVQENGQRKQSIPPRLRRQTLERDGYRCTTRGCTRTLDLQVHHLHERQHGGLNQIGNLVTLCRRCHEDMHRGWRSLKPSASATHSPRPTAN